MRTSCTVTILRLVCFIPLASAFAVLPYSTISNNKPEYESFSSSPAASKSSASLFPRSISWQRRRSQQTTKLFVLLDVPDYFFTITLPLLSVFLAFSKNVARSRLEERAWEQRLEEARGRLMQQDPSLTEWDLRRSEAAAEWSAYGNTNKNEEYVTVETNKNKRRRVMVQERMDQDEEEDSAESLRRRYTMTDEEIETFEREFGIKYDPYYDDPYTEDELPEDVKYRVDRQYGDRIYQDGEVFYKDKSTGLYYRQGAQPRMQKFWKF